MNSHGDHRLRRAGVCTYLPLELPVRLAAPFA